MAFFQPTTLTWAQAKSRVAQIAGSQSDSDQLVQAGYALEEAMRYWENFRDWKYTLSSTSVSLTLDDTTYTLPSDYKKMYDVRLTVLSPRVLSEISIREYDLRRPYQPTSVGTVPMAYYVTDAEGTGILTLVPGQGLTGETMLVRYYRKHTIPAAITAGTTASDATVLDFPAKYDYALLTTARWFYLLQKGGDDARMQMMANLAAQNITKARAEDEWTPNTIAGIQSNTYNVGVPYDPNYPYGGDY